MMNFKIPKQFELMGQIISVEWVDSLQHESDSYGTANFRDNKICLQRPSKHIPLSEDKLNHIFFHELSHWILCMMGEEELKLNEKFVDNFGGLLHQSIKSAKGELRY